MGEKALFTPTGRWIVGGAIAVALGLAALGISQFMNRPSAKQAAPVPVASPQSASAAKITALGRIEPAGEVVKVGGPSGERIGRLLVKEGQAVTVGQPIAYLESYDEQLASKNVSQSQLKDALAQFSSTQQYGDAQIAEAQTRRSQSNSPKLKELAAQTATITRIQSELAIALKDLQRFQSLQTSGCKRHGTSRQAAGCASSPPAKVSRSLSRRSDPAPAVPGCILPRGAGIIAPLREISLGD